MIADDNKWQKDLLNENGKYKQAMGVFRLIDLLTMWRKILGREELVGDYVEGIL